MTRTHNNVKEICDHFINWMWKNGYTQQEVAKILEVSRSHLNKVINGRTNPSIYLLEKMEKLMEE
jgi:DNA-binding XRE family transcriptional regulator